MKFKDLFLFLEQEDDWGAPLPADEPDGDLPGDQDPPPPDEGEGMGPINQNEPEPPPEPDRPAKPKKLSATQQIKQKWLSQNPALTDFQMAEAIQFFRDRSGRLKEYHPYGYRNPDNNRHWINTPEITSLVQRFPEMEPTLSNLSKMLDLKNYPWEVMEFYMEMIQANNTIVREENVVISTELSFDEQLEIAKRYWTTPGNLILNEGGVTIYKIESKQESVKWGAIGRILNQQRRAPQNKGGFDNSTGALYWCTTVPPTETRTNLWGTYRPQNGFYYVWDQNKPYNPTDNSDSEGKFYFTSLMANRNGTYTTVDMYNGTITGRDWSEIVNIFPVLNGKQQLFPHFGETSKERISVTLDAVTMRKGDKYYIGGLSDATKLAYVEDGRHINNVEAFTEMPFNVRKAYVNFTTLENDDIRTRFVSDDTGDAFGILNFLYLENKPFNLYKFLHKDILQEQLGIKEGINAIKKLIIGNNFKRWITDDNSNHTLIANQTNKVTDQTKFGLMNIADGEFIKDVIYTRPPKTTELFARVVNVEGIDRRIPIVLQKYVATQGDANYDNDDYFYVFTTQDAMMNRNSENYLKGQIFDGPEGEQFIEQQIAAGTLKSLSRRRG